MDVSEDAFDEVEDFLKTLPACLRCRKNRRRCDASLPRCQNCSKAGVDECTFRDHILGQDLPRSYVVSLVSRLRDLRSPIHTLSKPEASSKHNSPEELPSSRSSDEVEHVTKFLSVQSSSRYFGPASCLRETFPAPENVDLMSPLGTEPLKPESLLLLEEASKRLTVNPSMHRFLVQNYFATVHPLCPFLDATRPSLSIDQVIDTNISPSDDFIRQMVYAISCHCVPKDANRFLLLANACHRRAMTHLSEATSELNLETLHNVTLLALHSLFEPQKGNFGQLIGFAGRLCIDLGGMTSEGDVIGPLYRSVYCMEASFTNALDRPPFLPMPPQSTELQAMELTQLLCSLLNLQSRLRLNPDRQDHHASQLGQFLLLKRHIEQHWSSLPNLISVLRETELVIEPDSPTCASALLHAYANPLSIHSCLTPQWIYRAASILLRSSQDGQHQLHLSEYELCLGMLERDSVRWPSSAGLIESLKFAIRQPSGAPRNS